MRFELKKLLAPCGELPVEDGRQQHGVIEDDPPHVCIRDAALALMEEQVVGRQQVGDVIKGVGR